MANWLLPAVKAILPHLGNIISAAIPVFTKKRNGGPVDGAALLQQQIDELQTAVSTNAQHIHELAEELQRALAALEQGAGRAQAHWQRTALLAAAAAGMAIAALALALVLVFTR